LTPSFRPTANQPGGGWLSTQRRHGTRRKQNPEEETRAATPPSPVFADGPPPFRAVPIDATTVVVSGDVDAYAALDLAAALADPIVDRLPPTSQRAY